MKKHTAVCSEYVVVGDEARIQWSRSKCGFLVIQGLVAAFNSTRSRQDENCECKELIRSGGFVDCKVAAYAKTKSPLT